MVDENDIYRRIAENHSAIYKLERQVAGLLDLVAKLQDRLGFLEVLGPGETTGAKAAVDFEARVQQILKQHPGRRLDAIKAVRAEFRIQLIDAKRLVDAYWKE